MNWAWSLIIYLLFLVHSDFFGLNHYTTLYSEDVPPDSNFPLSYWKDQDTRTWQDPQWPDAESSWHKSVPWGVRGLLNWIKNEYGSEWEIFITENGFSTADIYDLSDDDRVRFYRGYINEVLKGNYLWQLSLCCWSSIGNEINRSVRSRK